MCSCFSYEDVSISPLSINFALQPTTEDEDQEEWLTTNEDWPRRLTTKNVWPQSIFTTTTTPAPSDDAVFGPFVILCSVSLRHFFDLWERVRVHLLTYEVEREFEWKFSIVLPDVNTLWDNFSVKRRVYMQILAHKTMTVCTVSNTISHSFILRDVCLQNCINCNTWRRARFLLKGTSLHHFD